MIKILVMPAKSNGNCLEKSQLFRGVAIKIAPRKGRPVHHGQDMLGRAWLIFLSLLEDDELYTMGKICWVGPE